MKAITLTQPWASLVALEHKRYETRSWQTSYRGPLAIHAAKGFPRECRELCDTEPFRTCLKPIADLAEVWGVSRSDWPGKVLPRGQMVAVARLVGIARTEDIRAQPGTAGGGWPHELAFGDYADGRYAWHLIKVNRLPWPHPECSGKLGLWDWTGPDWLDAWVCERGI